MMKKGKVAMIKVQDERRYTNDENACKDKEIKKCTGYELITRYACIIISN